MSPPGDAPAAARGEDGITEMSSGRTAPKIDRKLLDRALAYAERGWFVFPVHNMVGGRCSCAKGQNCKDAGKHPRTMNGFKDASVSPDQIIEWWTTWPQANIAVATGAGSGMFVIDIDRRHDGFASIDRWEEERGEPLPATLVSLTGGGGRHLFFKHPGDVVPGRIGWLPGVDVKSDGGYVVLPESNHISGAEYRWLDLSVPIEPAPSWLIESITNGSTSPTSSGKFNLADALGGIAEGARDDAIFRFACWARRVLRDDVRLVELATSDVAARCNPPFPKEQALVKVKQAFKQDHDNVRFHANLWSQMIDSSAGWESPIPLASKDKLPDFPVEALAPAVRDMASAVAESTQTPIDLAAGLALAVTSAATVGRVSVRVVDDWCESSSIYFLGLIESANRKSAVASLMTKPLWNLQSQMREALAPDIRRRKHDIEKLEKLKSNLARKLGGIDPSAEAAYDVASQQLDLARAALPVAPLLVVDDATPEAIAQEMNRQGERLAVFDAEGGGIITMTGARYGSKDSGPYLDLLLKGHAGDPTGSIRVGREPVAMHRPVLVIGVLSQPETLRELKGVSGSEGRGLIGRLTIAAPRDLLGRRKIETEQIPAVVISRWDLLISQLVAQLWPRLEPVELVLTREALVLVREFQEEVEDRLLPDGDLRELTSFGGKVVGAAVRYAAMHHLGTYAAGGLTYPVQPESIEAGIAIARWSIEHHRWAVYAGGWRPETAGANRLLAWLGKAALTEFSRRDAQRECPGFSDAASLDAPLTLLEEHGYIRASPGEGGQRRGRPPSPRYLVNPAAWQPDK